MPSAYENPIVLANPEKCIGCKKCEIACVSAHINLPFKEAKKRGLPTISRIKVVKVDNVRYPIQCRHCEDAPCAHACPFGAIQQLDGLVSVSETLCVGCKMCVMACPFGAIEVGVEGETAFTGRTNSGSAKKCDMCQAWRADTGKEVCACVEACPKQALQYVELGSYRQAMAKASVAQLAQVSVIINETLVINDTDGDVPAAS
ncbi:MAG: 4Fe-4S dicluster domain-containing protein [Desulfovibrio sp.]|jgi:carbon-monoxide dehydrogenase iron sulfur subunit|nr:4Fe-4S dicluster domain-containing protein [Desulfovibrio sp.]